MTMTDSRIAVGLLARDKEQTFLWLERAFEARSEEISIVRVNRPYDYLRSDPRYAYLERRVGLPK
jgi:hypothetical protein